ncbi:MAG: hypothetical protein WDN30_08405 [Pararobbsia sp.]
MTIFSTGTKSSSLFSSISDDTASSRPRNRSVKPVFDTGAEQASDGGVIAQQGNRLHCAIGDYRFHERCRQLHGILLEVGDRYPARRDGAPPPSPVLRERQHPADLVGAVFASSTRSLYTWVAGRNDISSRPSEIAFFAALPGAVFRSSSLSTPTIFCAVDFAEFAADLPAALAVFVAAETISLLAASWFSSVPRPE